ncbi:hypothetical protein G3I68_24625 [Streptomyces sp. SID13588]|nr:hypothetical protein [Streptomyces sp. SID13588]
MNLTEAPRDGFLGWRPVSVTDPSTLTVQPLSLPTAEPVVGVGVPVTELYRDPSTWTPPEPGRAGPFPVGQGPDLRMMLRNAEREAERKVQARAVEAEAEAAQRLHRVEELFQQRADQAEQAAARREEQAVLRVQQAVERQREAEWQAAEQERETQQREQKARTREREAEEWAAERERLAEQRATDQIDVIVSQAQEAIAAWTNEVARLTGDAQRLRTEHSAELNRVRAVGLRNSVLSAFVVAVLVLFLVVVKL